MQGARVLAAVLLSFGLLGFEFSRLSGLCCRGLLLGFVQLGDGHEDRKLRQPVFCSLVTGSDEYLGIKMGILVAGNFMQLQGVLVAVIGDDMDVR